jgi:hypothetical protein
MFIVGLFPFCLDEQDRLYSIKEALGSPRELKPVYDSADAARMSLGTLSFRWLSGEPNHSSYSLIAFDNDMLALGLDGILHPPCESDIRI